ncbi:MAG: hypothetical protein ACKO1F_17745, partial [Flammeovirgaceae bacterium]
MASVSEGINGSTLQRNQIYIRPSRRIYFSTSSCGNVGIHRQRDDAQRGGVYLFWWMDSATG